MRSLRRGLLVLALCLVSVSLSWAGAGVDLRQSNGTVTQWGGTGDTAKVTGAVTNAGTFPVQVSGHSFLNITLAAPTTTVVKSGAGVLHTITVNKTTALGVIQCFDNTAASGTVIATITQPAAVLASNVSLVYDAGFATGLTCLTSTAAQDITVSYR